MRLLLDSNKLIPRPMQRKAYFNFTRLCSNLFYIMMLVDRDGGGREEERGRYFILMHPGIRFVVCAPLPIKN